MAKTAIVKLLRYGVSAIFILIFANVYGAKTAPFSTALINGKILLNAFACPTLITENLNIVASSCNGSDGAILGIQGTGTGILSYTWKDAAGNIVGTNANLTNVPTGVYIVELRDESKCIATVSNGYLVPIKNQVVFNDTNTQITKPGCNATDGSIKGIIANNAVQYQWTNSSGKVLANTLNLVGVGADSYTLTATNKDGCGAKKNYLLPAATSVPKIADTIINDAGCNELGSVTVKFNITATDPTYRYELLQSSQGNTVQTGVIVYVPNAQTSIQLNNLTPGLTYDLYSIDPTNCRSKIAAFKMKPPAIYSISRDSAVFHPDYCGQHIGAIVGLRILGGVKPDPRQFPQGYYWRDSTGNRIASTLYLSGVGAGIYTLEVRNASCRAYATFTITDSTSIGAPPLVDDISLCLPQTITIALKGPGPATGYRLYDAEGNLIMQNNAPRFLIKVTETSVFYATALNATCETDKTKFTVSVTLPGVEIPNTFTPNGDGYNDNWVISGLENYPDTDIAIYNIYGEKVYHSINYSQPFNGIRNGKILPAGVYYYIINTKKTECKGKIAGSLTIIR